MFTMIIKELEDKEFRIALRSYTKIIEEIITSIEKETGASGTLGLLKLILSNPQYVEVGNAYKKAFEEAKDRYRQNLVNQLKRLDKLCAAQDGGDLTAVEEMRLLFLGERYVNDEEVF